MDEQFLQMNYEYYRIGHNQNQWTSQPLSYAEWKTKIQTCAVCPKCGGVPANTSSPSKLNWIPYAIGGFLVGIYTKKK